MVKNFIKHLTSLIFIYSILISYYKILPNDLIELQKLTANLQNLSNIVIDEPIKPEKFNIKDTVISIDNKVRQFNRKWDEKSFCNAEYWENKLENSCKCCLTINAGQLDSHQPSEIVKICLDAGHCSNPIIQKMLKDEAIDYGDKEKNLRELISRVFNKSVVIKEISTENIKLGPDGLLNEDTVKKLLVEAYRTKKLNDAHFKNVSCLHADNILAQEKGRNTQQLFSIRSTCLHEKANYILKGISSGISETDALEAAKLNPKFSPYIYPKINPEYPSFIFPIAYVSYVFYGKNHYLSLMPKAPGIGLLSSASKYENKTMTQSDIEEAYYRVGFALSKFHLQFEGHGDAHQDNIFFDKATNRVILIDNEGLVGENFNEIDIEVFIFGSLTLIPDSIKNHNSFDAWILLSIRSFLKGYRDAIATDKRRAMLDELSSNFSKPSGYRYYYLYDEYTKKKNIFGKIFEELKKIYR